MIRKPFLRTPYNYDADEVSVETGLECLDESLAQQHQRDEADINVIVKRFGVTGHLPVVERLPLTEDFDEVFDYRSALDQLNAAKAAFMQLDGEMRYRFHNNPAEFVEFCSNPDNLPELRKMGLAREEAPPPAPMRVEVVNGERSGQPDSDAGAAQEASGGGSP